MLFCLGCAVLFGFAFNYFDIGWIFSLFLGLNFTGGTALRNVLVGIGGLIVRV